MSHDPARSLSHLSDGVVRVSYKGATSIHFCEQNVKTSAPIYINRCSGAHY